MSQHEQRIQVKLQKCRRMLGNVNNSVTDIVAAVSLFWQCYFISGKREMLHEANHTAVTAFAAKPGSIDIYLCMIFINLELGNTDAAAEQLRQLRSYRNYYKSKNHATYALLAYFQAILHKRVGNENELSKAVDALEDFVAERLERGDLQHEGFVLCVLGAAIGIDGRNADSFAALEESFERGYRGPFLYALAYKLLGDKLELSGTHRLIVSTFRWCVGHGLDIRQMADFYADNISFAGRPSYLCYEALLTACDSEWLLEKLTARLIESGDYSRQASSYYRMAENKQLRIDGLATAVVRSAFENKLDDISRHSLKQFLSDHTFELDNLTDTGLASYVYHQLITNKKLSDLTDSYHDDILEFACYAYDSKIGDADTGRYINSSYKYFVEYCLEFERRNGISLTDSVLSSNDSLARLAYYAGAISAKLSPCLFTYELTFSSPEVRQVWVSEKDKRRSQPYDVADGRVRVSAVGADFSCVCFAADMRALVDTQIRVTKYAPRASFELLHHCYRKGISDDNLLIALARYFISLEGALERSVRVIRKHSDKLALGVEILSRSLKLECISESFATRATTALGSLCAALDNHTAALDYYTQIGDKYISDKHVEKMLEVFMETAQIERAARLISAKPHCIKERALFKALVRILTVVNASPDNPEKQALIPGVVNVAYELMLKSWFDKAFLEIVLQYYRGAQEEWHALSSALHQLGADDARLDEKIIRDSLFTHSFCRGSQRVFARMYGNDPRHAIVPAYLTNCVYEIIINGVAPEPEIIDILERQFIKYRDVRLGCGLVYAYLQGGVTTTSSDYILQRAFAAMQSRGILLPPFKGVKDKNAFGTYLVKNTPFVYRTLPDKEVYLVCRFSPDSDFVSIKMNYLFFGLYTCHVVQFSGETIEYYFSETSKSGSVDTKMETIASNEKSLLENTDDPYFMLNNALIYEQMFRYDKVEEIVSDYLRDDCMIKGELL